MTILPHDNLVHWQWKGVHYVNAWCHDQVACGLSQTGFSHWEKGLTLLLDGQISSRFHPGPIILDIGTAAVLWDRLPRYRAITEGSKRPEKGHWDHQGASLHNPSKSPTAAAKKGGFDNLLACIFEQADHDAMIPPKPEASIDATGLESRYVSRHYLWRQGKRTSQYRCWTKLTILCDNASHLIAGAMVSRGPNNDSPCLPPVTTQAMQWLPIDSLLADAGFDAESNHVYCRQTLGIRSTVIPVNMRRRSQGMPKGRYRQQMARRFPKRTFGQRWQVESVFSRFKRRLGYALRARCDESRALECLMRVVTYDLMILFSLFIKSIKTIKIRFC